MRGVSKEATIRKICEAVLKRITPSAKEREAILRFTTKLVETLAEQLQSVGIRAEVRIQGSIAKDTWLAGDPDIDVFILLPKTSTRKAFPQVLDVVKAFVGEEWVEAYAEHPYLIAQIDNYTVEFVPGFKVDRAEDASSSVDRSPLHAAYIREHLDQKTRDEVRLFKQFTRGIGVYGAEIRVTGLSGYLCELLVLHHHSFLTTLQALASQRPGQLVDLARFYEGREEEAQRLFRAPLIVVDPVDAKRNVAAAVSKEKLAELMMAAQLFLLNPEEIFFFPEKTVPLSSDALAVRLAQLEFDLLVIVFNWAKRSPDVLWGQLYKTSRALTRLMVKNEFQVLRSTVWSDEKALTALVFALEAKTIPVSKKHRGPPVDSEDALRFVVKYTASDLAVVGPWAENDRWVVGVKRRWVDAAALLRESLRGGGTNVGLARGLIEDLKDAQVYINLEILVFYKGHEDFACFLTDFLHGRPKWMELPARG